MGDTRFGAYPDVTSAIHPEREDDDGLATQSTKQSEYHCTTRSEVFNVKETEDSSSKEYKDGQATEDCIVLEVTDQAQDSNECLVSEEDKL